MNACPEDAALGRGEILTRASSNPPIESTISSPIWTLLLCLLISNRQQGRDDEITRNSWISRHLNLHLKPA